MRKTTLLKCLLTLAFGSLFVPAASAQLNISEFRLRGPAGATDEFIEIYNFSGSSHTVAGGGTGYAIAASNGVARCVIPNGTVIPDRGHFLCVNSSGYSLASYPAGNGTTATGDATFTTDIPDNAGIAIFTTSIAANFTLANRMDAVGSTSEANTLYKEGPGYPSLAALSLDYSFHRDMCGKQGSVTAPFTCTLDGPKDTNSNSADFIFADTQGFNSPAGQRIGAPGPENLSSPIGAAPSSPNILVNPLDSCSGAFSSPNAVRDPTSNPGNNSTFGTIEFRFKVTNLTGAPLTRLRFRIVDLSIFPATSGNADLRPLTSTTVIVNLDNPPCGSGTTNLTVNGTTIESPPSQPSGAGFNSSLSWPNITPATPLANGESKNVRILMGAQLIGYFKLGLIIESLPRGGKMHYLEGSLSPSSAGGVARGAPFDFGDDGKTDVSIFRPSNGQWWHRNSANGAVAATTFGVSTDRTIPGDFTGDRVADRAFFRPSTGEWFVLRSENSTFYSVPFGVSTDIPAPGDFDGDGKLDLAVFRPASALWIIQSSATGQASFIQWGNSSDLPVVGDYDGDRKSDIAIWRRTGGSGSGEWWIRFSGGSNIALAFGNSSDKAVPGNYTGDDRTDIAFWRPSNGTWFVLRSEDFSFYAVPFGISTDLPVPGDYDGDSRQDFAVFRPSSATWYISNSTGIPATIISFGLGTDQPLPNTFVR